MKNTTSKNLRQVKVEKLLKPFMNFRNFYYALYKN